MDKRVPDLDNLQGNPVKEIRCQFIILARRKSGVGSSFLPEKTNRHRAKKLGKGGSLQP